MPDAGARRDEGSGDQEAAFERRLAREILGAERFRVTLLAVIPELAMLLFLAIAGAAYRELMAPLHRGTLDPRASAFFLGGVAAFEF